MYLIYRLTDFTKHTRRTTLPGPTWLGKEIYEEACALLQGIPRGAFVRLIGVGLTGFDDAVQGELFAQTTRTPWEASEKAVDNLAARFGDGTVVRARELLDSDRSRPSRERPER